MAKKGGNPEYLKVPTSQEARKYGAEGGRKSGIVRKEKKLISQIYAEILANDFKLKEKKEIINGKEILIPERSFTLSDVVSAVLARQDNASVSMIKELREGTEGNKMELTGKDGTPIKFAFVDPPSATPS